ncbi:MAG: 50S ribosomal protein L20 [Spartobacteria bacterium]|nr:50S ribosomal protein L20 [Spartobacteria bacterium]
MPRVTNAVASRKRRKRRLNQAKGFYGSRSKLFRIATEAVDRSMALSYAHRKEKKREYRGTWIVRLSAACKLNEISYSRFIEGLTKAGIELNRKMLSEIAIHDAEGFASLAKIAKAKATIAVKKK